MVGSLVGPKGAGWLSLLCLGLFSIHHHRARSKHFDFSRHFPSMTFGILLVSTTFAYPSSRRCSPSSRDCSSESSSIIDEEVGVAFMDQDDGFGPHSKIDEVEVVFRQT